MAKRANGVFPVMAVIGVALTAYQIYDKWRERTGKGPLEWGFEPKGKKYESMVVGKFFNVKFKGDSLQFEFNISNPNHTDLAIHDVVGDVYITNAKGGNAILVGKVNHKGMTVIKPNGQHLFSMVVVIKAIQAIQFLVGVFTGKLKNQWLLFRGNIVVNGKDWPITEHARIV